MFNCIEIFRLAMTGVNLKKLKKTKKLKKRPVKPKLKKK